MNVSCFSVESQSHYSVAQGLGGQILLGWMHIFGYFILNDQTSRIGTSEIPHSATTADREDLVNMLGLAFSLFKFPTTHTESSTPARNSTRHAHVDRPSRRCYLARRRAGFLRDKASNTPALEESKQQLSCTCDLFQIAFSKTQYRQAKNKIITAMQKIGASSKEFSTITSQAPHFTRWEADARRSS